MTELVEFKKEIKKLRSNYKGTLKKLDVELKEIEKMWGLIKIEWFYFKNRQYSIKFPLAFDRFKIFLEYAKNSGVSEEKIFCDLTYRQFYEFAQKSSKSFYNALSDISLCIGNEQINNFINLSNLLLAFHVTNTPFEVAFKIFGMAAGFDANYVLKNKDCQFSHSLVIMSLGEYFNEDGSLKLNRDIEWFRFQLNSLLNDFIISSENLSDCETVKDDCRELMITFKALEHAFVYLLQDGILKLENRMDEQDEELEDMLDEVGLKPTANAMDELRRYYRNNALVELPENIEDFYVLLDECQIFGNERKYILHLLEEKLSKLKENKILNYLNVFDKALYEDALVLLNSMHYSNSDYYPLVQLMDDLRTAGEMLEEDINNDDEAYILMQIEELMQGLRLILEKHLGKNQVTENNFVFLCNSSGVPYLKEDSDKIDGSFYKAVCNGIKKIRKDNQGNFKLVMTSDNMPYRLYDILSSKIHISFIEIDNGIYLIVGANIVSQGYDELVRRVISYEPSIKELELLVKDARTRNQILSNHEEYLELFNPENPNFGRKRVNLDSKN